MVNKTVTYRIIHDMIINTKQWLNIGKFLCLLPFIINIQKLSFVESSIIYSSNMISIGLLGSFYGFLVSAFEQREQVDQEQIKDVRNEILFLIKKELKI